MPIQHGLQIHPDFFRFVNEELLPLTKLNREAFWQGFASIISDLSPLNRRLLAQRDALQKQIDDWHDQHRHQQFDHTAYKAFLQEIGYLLEEGEDFNIVTNNVDREIAHIAGPQLVVPISNARFALNAVNARWGSLYDALYGTDAIPFSEGLELGAEHNPARAQEAVDVVKNFLDKVFPLSGGSHEEVIRYFIKDQALHAYLLSGVCVELVDQQHCVAIEPGGTGKYAEPRSFVLKNNELHLVVHIDREGLLGKRDPAGINDVELEAAPTVIMDCEDSVAAVDTEDKILVYRNWLGLIQGSLSCDFHKNGKRVNRTMRADRQFTALDGNAYSLPGRALMLNRNVGHLMTCSLILDEKGKEVFEGIVDAVITGLINSLDLQGESSFRNSKRGSIYIVKPKMHGPEEVEFTCNLFTRVEELLRLPADTIKLGIMDEERRTTLNLKECIRAAKSRVVFINTGFLDRTGDEIHTSMHAGAFLPKDDLKAAAWIGAYENWNVDVGLRCGLPGWAQIGKGMWAMPDEMHRMLNEKIVHPRSGASTAWVPSPTAAVLHAMHYHRVKVSEVQKQLRYREPAALDDILDIPLLSEKQQLDSEVITRELQTNIQAILGYVVRWVDQGVGCSKVPNLDGVSLMEDRATLRISSQHIGNWLLHEVCSAEQVRRIMQEMAAVVDKQNANIEGYRPMTKDLENSLAFRAAEELIFNACEHPNGYTEPCLHRNRFLVKHRGELFREAVPVTTPATTSLAS